MHARAGESRATVVKLRQVGTYEVIMPRRGAHVRQGLQERVYGHLYMFADQAGSFLAPSAEPSTQGRMYRSHYILYITIQ